MPKYNISIVVSGKDKASRPLGAVRNALSGVWSVMGGIIGARVLSTIANGLRMLGAGAVESVGVIQNLNVALDTLLSRELRLSALAEGKNLPIEDALQQALPLVKSMIGKLRDLSIISPFKFKTIEDTFRMQMAFGATSKQALDLTTNILDLSAGLGLTNEATQRLGYNLAQVIKQQQVMGLDLRQLRMVGLDLAQVFQEELGKSVEDVNKGLKSGAMSTDDLIAALNAFAKHNFAGAAERMSRTIIGLKSSFADAALFIRADIFGPVIDIITEKLGGVLDLLKIKMADGTFKRWGKELGDSLQTAIDNLGVIRDKFNSIKNIFAAFAAGRTTAGLMMLGLNKDQIALFWEVSRVFDHLKESFGKIKDAFVENSPAMREALGRIRDDFAKLFEALGGKMGDISVTEEGVVGMIDAVTNAIVNGVPKIADGLNAFAGFLENTLFPLIMQIRDVFGLAAQWLMSNIDIIESVLAGFAAAWLVIKAAAIPAIISGIIGSIAGLIAVLTAPVTLLALGLGVIVGLIVANWEMLKGLWDLWIAGMVAWKDRLVETVDQLLFLIKFGFDKFLHTDMPLTVKSFFDFGVQIVKGMWDGLKAEWNAMADWLKSMINNLTSGVKNALGIHSPSTVFADIGKNMMVGLKQGITKHAAAPQNAIRNTMRTMNLTMNYTGIPLGESEVARAMRRAEAIYG